jgi:hypothetical protein
MMIIEAIIVRMKVIIETVFVSSLEPLKIFAWPRLLKGSYSISKVLVPLLQLRTILSEGCRGTRV